MENSSKKDGWFETLKYILLALAIVIPLRIFVAEPFIVSGHSMDNTFVDGEYIIINELSFHFRDPIRGEVIIFRPPVNLKTYYIKRVIGLPGETVSIKDGQVTVTTVKGDKLNLTEPYVINKDGQDMSAITLGENQYFVLGDNRPVSSDSRVWGVLPRENIVGTPMVSLIPVYKAAFNPGDYKFDN